jgi:prevent-host-death family protein
MRVSVSDAKGQLTELVRRAEAGGEVVLTRHGKPAARLVRAESAPVSGQHRRAVLEAVRRAGGTRTRKGPSAGRSQDFLYDEGSGLPR